MIADDAYAAGFFDGEGTIDIRYRTTNGGRYDRFELRCAASQVSTHVLDWLVSVYGGSWATRKNGAISHWTIVGQEAASFLTAIRPYLRVKGEQADVAIEFGRLASHKGRHGAGKKGFHRIPDDAWEQRRDLMIKLRQQRDAEGVRARNRNPIPSSRPVFASA